jgi:hypothetical protein
MAHSSGWISIKNMTKEILLETGRDMGEYKKLMHYVINGVRDLNIYHYDNVKTVKKICNDIGVINFPSDYVSFVSLAMADGGLIWTLTRRDDLIRTTTELNGDETLDSTIGEGVDIDTGTNYGYKTIGGKNDYYYTLEEENNRIIVRPVSTTRTFFLQYITSGIDLDDGNETTIPVKIKEALKYWVLYKEAMNSDSGNKNLVAMYKNEYREEVSKLRFLQLPTADELRDMVYANYERLNR